MTEEVCWQFIRCIFSLKTPEEGNDKFYLKKERPPQKAKKRDPHRKPKNSEISTGIQKRGRQRGLNVRRTLFKLEYISEIDESMSKICAYQLPLAPFYKY